MDLTKFAIRIGKFEEEVTIPESLYKDTDIVNIPPFSLMVNVYEKNQDYYLQLEAQVELTLQDAITLEPVGYDFPIQIEEKISSDSEILGKFLQNNQNSLDIIAILWENIVLEIPISYTKASVQNEYHDGWELIEEKKDEIDIRLAPLLEIFDEEKEGKQ